MPYNHLYALLNLLPDKLWCWYSISRHPKITWEIVQAHSEWPLNWKGLSENQNITCQIIEENPNYPWVWERVSLNPNVTWDFISRHLDRPWRWRSLSYHRNITLDIILDNPNYPWSWSDISRQNPNITWDIIKDNLHLPWDWKALADNKNIKWKIIEENMCWLPDQMIIISKSKIKRDRFYSNFMSNANKVDYLKTLPINYNDPEVDWFHLSRWSPISWKIVKDHQNHQWNWGMLSLNHFSTHNKIVKIQRLWRKHRKFTKSQAVTKISRWWKPIYYRPDGPHHAKVNKRIESGYYHSKNGI